MYILIVSDAPVLPVDICVASAMLGHAAWAVRPDELAAGAGTRPALVLLDLASGGDRSGSLAAIRSQYDAVPIAVVAGDTEPSGPSDSTLRLSRPASPTELREVIRRANPVAA